MYGLIKLIMTLQVSRVHVGAHGMGVLRAFAIRKEFEAFCSFFDSAKERRSVLSWLRKDSESADPYTPPNLTSTHDVCTKSPRSVRYLDCLQQIHQIFGDGSDSSSPLKYARDDYYGLEERIISLICRHEQFGYGSRAVRDVDIYYLISIFSFF